MRSFSTKLTAILTIAALGLAAASAFADGNKGKKSSGFSFSNGKFGVSIGNGNKNHGNYNNNGNYNRNKYNNSCHNNGGNYGGYPGGYPYGQGFEPYHSSYICQPGDVFYTVSMKEYGTSAAASHIARFNRLPVNAALVAGQRLMLPSVSANGVLSASRAPAPFVDATTPTTSTNPTAKFSLPTSVANATLANKVTVAPATEPALPSVAVGSTLVLDGQEFGEVQGLARLRVGGLSLPIEVLEWTNDSVKIRLPEVDLTSPMKAEIGVLRADGSTASTSAVELKSAVDRLASGN